MKNSKDLIPATGYANAISVVVCLLVLGGLGLGLGKLQLNSDARVFFSPDNPLYRDLSGFESKYQRRSRANVCFVASEGEIYRQDRLQRILDFNGAAWSIPQVTRVDDLTNAVFVSSDESELVVEDVLTRENVSDGAAVRSRAEDSRANVGRLTSTDRSTACSILEFDLGSGEQLSPIQLRKELDSTLRSLDLAGVGLSAFVTGRLALSSAFASASRTDLLTRTPASLVAIFLVSWLFLRNFKATVALCSLSFLAAVGAMGFGGWAGYSINPATGSVPTIVFSIGVATLMHIVVLATRLIDKGVESPRASSRAIVENLVPFSITLGTTAIGFLALNSADAPPFRQLGNLVAVGCGLCWVFGVLALPGVLRAVRIRGNEGSRPIETSLVQFAQLVARRPRTLALLGGGLLCIPLSGVFDLTIDDNFDEYLDESFEYRTAVERAQRIFGGTAIVEIDLATDADDGIFRPEYLARVKAFEDWAAKQDRVAYVTTVVEIFERMDRHVRGNGTEPGGLPSNSDALAQYLLAYELSLRLGQDLGNVISMERNSTRASVLLRDGSSSKILQFKRDAEDWLRKHHVEGFKDSVTGLSVMYAFLTEINVRAMLGGTAAGLLVISGMLVLCFRSIRLGIFSLIPNLLPVAVALGIWGILGGDLGAAVAVVGAITLGIIVDDTVHLTWRFREGRRIRGSVDGAILHSFSTVGPPMAFSSLALIVGFLVVGTSGFLVTSSMGKLAALTVSAALFVDWLVYMPLLVWRDRQ